jgi:hypothetical protein
VQHQQQRTSQQAARAAATSRKARAECSESIRTKSQNVSVRRASEREHVTPPL